MVKKKNITKVDVIGAEKRYEPCKHYVYVVNVTWSDGTVFPVYRKFSDFYEMQIELLDLFPTEAGVGGNRILPFLPGVKLFGRSEIKKVADERKTHLSEYCRQLIGLPERVSQSHVVVDFFEARQLDINPPKDTQKRKESNGLISSLSLIFPKILHINKSSKSGSSTDSYPSDDLYVSGPVTFDTYSVIADYKANAKGEITLTEGQEVEVVEKNENGWWLVSSGSDQGWAPASFLEPLSAAEQDGPEPLYLGETFVTLAAYTAELEDEISFPKGVIVEAMHKLLDGWWIISYNGDVGHAPATFLAECHNPHVDIVPTKFKKVRQPTQRRCTIKTKIPSTKSAARRDLTLYRQLSAKNRRMQQKPARHTEKPPTPPSPMEDDVFSNQDTPDIYLNDEEVQTYLQPRESYELQKSCPYDEDVEYEVSVERVAHDDDDTQYINVDTTSSMTLPRTSSSSVDTKTPVPSPRGETLPRLPPKAPNSNGPVNNVQHQNNARIKTPLAFLKTNHEAKGEGAKRAGNQANDNGRLRGKGEGTKMSGTNGRLDSPLKVPTRTDRSPSPRGGLKPQCPKKPARDKNNENNKGTPSAPEKGLLAQRIAMFET